MDEVTFLSRKILDLNKQLIESEKAKSRFLSLIANALNNPMTVLLGIIPKLAPPSGDPREAIFGLAHEELLLLDFRVQNLVMAAEIESGSVSISNASVDINELLQEVLEALKYSIKARNMTIVVNCSVNDRVVTDPQKLHIILINLVANACDYGIEGSSINIEVVLVDSEISISVKNQGHEPDVEYTAQLFTRFAEGPEGKHGLGLGLSVVRELTQWLGGHVDYIAEDSTVKFTVTLPVGECLSNSEACGSNEFLFDSFDDAIEL